MKRLTMGVKACTETLGLLVGMAWADEVLSDEEKEGIRAAGETLNLNKELRERLESFMEQPPSLGSLDVAALNRRDREFAYVASAWMARVDEGVADAEREHLDKIGMALEIDPDRREELAKLAFDLEEPKPGESWSKGIVELLKTIVARIEAEEEEEAEEIDVIFE